MRIRSSAELGLIIRDRRLTLGLTQQQFAELVGVPRLWLVTMENGHGNPTFDRLQRVIQRSGLTLRIEEPAATPAAPTVETVDLNDLLDNWQA